MHLGKWITNFRVGPFEVVDANGVQWSDVYDQWGKKVAHKRLADVAVTLPSDAPTPAPIHAMPCKHCAVKFHAAHNYSCRRHGGAWQPSSARWACCGAAQEELGCTVHSYHVP